MTIMPAARFAPKNTAAAPTVSRVFSPAFLSEEHGSPNHVAPSVQATADVSSTTSPISSTDCAAVFLPFLRLVGSVEDVLPCGRVVQLGEPLLSDPAHELEPFLR